MHTNIWSVNAVPGQTNFVLILPVERRSHSAN
jgi:hypothetical protein